MNQSTQQSHFPLDDRLHWYKDAIIYELHIKAFSDSNGDGIGDFGGLMSRLDYLQELGVTAIWVLPFYPSPLKDDGYDIADYFSINPSYGDISQFREFLAEAHKRNLKVITELVINHTSDQHPWFQRARKAAKGSPERDFYVWSDDPTRYKDVRIIFQDFETSNWTWDPVAGQYYWHRFFHHQPDLNFDNPQVQQEVINVLDYWCEMGVDGFRLDAVPYLFEREGTNGENLPETHAFLKKLRQHIDTKFPGTVFLAEANMWPEDAASYFGDGDECHMNYHFPVMPRMFMALQREDRYPITDIFDQTPEIPPNCQWAMFLRNHDELTLEMVTDEERDYMYKVYAKDPKARINLGIRHRLAPLMDNDRRKIELMNSLLFSMPGTPVIYYGDEIGMGDNFYLGDRNGVRTPMQWSPDRNAGFSSANPHSLYLPVIIDPEYNYEAVNVELQRRNTASLFWFMKRLINLRKKYKAFGRGSMQFIPVDNPKILAFVRRYEEEALLIVVNLSKYAQPAELYLPGLAGYVPVELFSRNRFPGIREDAPYLFTLGAHSFQWFELQPAGAGQRRDDAIPEFTVDTLDDVLNTSEKVDLESIVLPGYLPQTSWFNASGRTIYSITLREKATISLPISNTHFLMLEVAFETGLPEWYILPVTFVKEPLAKSLRESCPQSVICQLTVNGEAGLLCDAYYTPELQHWLFYQFDPERSAVKGFAFHAREAFQKEMPRESIKPRLHTANHNNTSVVYDDKYFLKLYRKVDRETNPDLEIARYLTEKAGYPFTPQYLGHLEWQAGKEKLALGTMQELIENHGDGRSYMEERINNYIERILARENYLLLADSFADSLTQPVGHASISADLQALLGGPAVEQSRLIGKRVAQLHLALTGSTGEDGFQPEPFSLHYQRSLFSGMQSLVRETMQKIERSLDKVDGTVALELQRLLARREELLAILKQIYQEKLDALKVRIHGNLHLQQLLFTGRDISIHDFAGNPHRNYSEHRLRRSPLRDVASLIRSLFYVAYKTFLHNRQVPATESDRLLPFAGMWAAFMSNFLLEAYLEESAGRPFLPANAEERRRMLRIFLLEGAVYDLNHELSHRPAYAMIPLRLIDYILQGDLEQVTKKTPQPS
jgi:maltose alpha-D-glucosyltransferase/alpha-amylase